MLFSRRLIAPLIRLMQQVSHLFVGGRRKVFVPHTDGRKILRRDGTDDVIRFLVQFAAGRRGADGDGHDDLARFLLA
jgi:hypothetical protein